MEGFTEGKPGDFSKGAEPEGLGDGISTVASRSKALVEGLTRPPEAEAKCTVDIHTFFTFFCNSEDSLGV